MEISETGVLLSTDNFGCNFFCTVYHRREDQDKEREFEQSRKSRKVGSSFCESTCGETAD